MKGEPRFISMEAWEEARCKKPLSHDMNGKSITFLCLLMRGHEGRCAWEASLRASLRPGEELTLRPWP